MSDAIEFTRNYSDLSTQHGFQFEFHCDRCGNGVRTTFRPFAMGALDSALDTASSLLGGIFGSASNVSNRVTEAQRERAREIALVDAIKELRPQFKQCPKCQSWVCVKSCLNQQRGLCKNCAPDLQVEMSAAQAAKGVEGAWSNAQLAEAEEKQVTGSWKEVKQAACPACGASFASGVKFCPECGEKINAEKHCTECGAKLPPAAKFCAECGHKS